MGRGLRGTVVFAAFASAFVLSGCVLGTRNPTLSYPPASDAGRTSVAHAAETPPSRNVQIVLKPFADERSNTRTVGTTRNAFGMRMADVIPSNSVSDWVTRAVRAELESNGYSVIEGKQGDNVPSTSVIVSGEILNVFCDMYMSYTGQVSLVIRLNRDGKELLNRHYAGEGSAGLAIAATSESYSRSLALALQSALQKFVSDLNKTLAAEN
ncbi:MAG: hypothetical protein EPN57_22930 [Paraburkholderia sp.]|nr:MAG: hypothetical protein EPN57_22930 [Paraburkholderia sp.]